MRSFGCSLPVRPTCGFGRPQLPRVRMRLVRVEGTQKQKSRGAPGTSLASGRARRTEIVYLTSDSVASFMTKVQEATVLDLVQIERQGV